MLTKGTAVFKVPSTLSNAAILCLLALCQSGRRLFLFALRCCLRFCWPAGSVAEKSGFRI